jgi:hypothetical protein
MNNQPPLIRSMSATVCKKLMMARRSPATCSRSVLDRLSLRCHSRVRTRRSNGGQGGSIRTGQSDAKVIVRQSKTLLIRLGVKWSQVQILSARQSKPALTSVRAGFMLLEFLLICGSGPAASQAAVSGPIPRLHYIHRRRSLSAFRQGCGGESPLLGLIHGEHAIPATWAAWPLPRAGEAVMMVLS